MQPTSTTAGLVIAPAVQVTAQNAAGAVVTTFTGTVTVAIGANSGNATLSGTLTVPAVGGVATFSDLRLNRSGSGYTLVASSGSIPAGTSAPLAISPGPPVALAFTVQPSHVSAGTPIAPAVEVTAYDSLGNTAASFAGSVTMAIGTNPGGGTLSGTKTQAATAGVATFGNLSIEKEGVGYTLTAAASGVTGATSSAFSISAGGVSAAQSTVVAAPSQITASSGSSASTITVTARDSLGNPIAGAIVVLAASGTGNTLTQPAGQTNGSGVAAGALSSTAVGVKIVTATIGAVSVQQADSVTVVPGAATTLAFTVQPSTDTAGTFITPAVQVTAQDAQGNTVTAFTGNITVAIGTNPSGGTLSGTTSHTAVSGVATFNNLSIDKVGIGYTLTAAAIGFTGGTSAAFTITVGAPARLAFQVQPSAAAGGAAITPAVKVAVEDAGGNLVSTAANSVALAIAANPGGGTLSGGGSTPASAGVATFSALSINKVGTGYTLRATASGLTPDTSTTFDITAGSVSASQSQVSVSADTIGQCLVACATGTNATTVTVTVRDAGGNPLGSVPVILTVSPVPGTHPPDTVRFTNPGPSGSTNGSGAFSAVFNSGVAVSTTIKATAGGTPITQQPVVAVMRAVLVAGDIADCTRGSDDSTARLLDSLPGLVVADGDNAYPNGTPTNFTQCYDPTWGRHKSRTLPVLGNHEYDSSATAAGYFGYFTAAVADPLNTGIGYYSTDVGAWHVVVLNSEPAGTASSQLTWLQGDLVGKDNQCVLAFWHEPLFTSGPSNGATQTRRLWQALENAGAEIVVNGHDHFYERFAPQDSLANATAAGIREFIAGTGGGETHANFGTIAANDEANDSQNFSRGILRLTLYPGSYRWQFIPALGFGTFTDSGSTACH